MKQQNPPGYRSPVSQASADAQVDRPLKNIEVKLKVGPRTEETGHKVTLDIHLTNYIVSPDNSMAPVGIRR